MITSSIRALLKGLDEFVTGQAEDTGIASLMGNLEKWKNSSKSSMMVAEITEAVEACSRLAVPDVDLKQLGTALGQLQHDRAPAGFPGASLQSSLQSLLPHILQNFKLRVDG